MQPGLINHNRIIHVDNNLLKWLTSKLLPDIRIECQFWTFLPKYQDHLLRNATAPCRSARHRRLSHNKHFPAREPSEKECPRSSWMKNNCVWKEGDQPCCPPLSSVSECDLHHKGMQKTMKRELFFMLLCTHGQPIHSNNANRMPPRLLCIFTNYRPKNGT